MAAKLAARAPVVVARVTSRPCGCSVQGLPRDIVGGGCVAWPWLRDHRERTRRLVEALLEAEEAPSGHGAAA
jgi:hypothetical protein